MSDLTTILKGLSTITGVGARTSSTQFKKVFLFMDTEKHASPFDMLTVIDIFPDAVILKYDDVTAEDAERIVHDAMFPRGPQGAKQTKIFINGHDLKRVNDVLERVEKCMFPPFELAVIVDPRGAYTTAAAAVVKTLELLLGKGFGDLETRLLLWSLGQGLWDKLPRGSTRWKRPT